MRGDGVAAGERSVAGDVRRMYEFGGETGVRRKA
jgi:hypothetical protein